MEPEPTEDSLDEIRKVLTWALGERPTTGVLTHEDCEDCLRQAVRDTGYKRQPLVFHPSVVRDVLAAFGPPPTPVDLTNEKGMRAHWMIVEPGAEFPTPITRKG